MLLAMHVLVILVAGGYILTFDGITLRQRRVTWFIIALVVLIIIRYPVKGGCFSIRVYSGHEGIVLFALFLIIYLSTGKGAWSTDTLAARYLPLSIIREGNFDLDEFSFLSYIRWHRFYTHRPEFSVSRNADGDSPPVRPPAYLSYTNGHYVSEYPVGAAILALPFYLPSALGHVSPESVVIQDLEKISAAVMVALSAAVLYGALCILTSQSMALLVVAVYACGTSSLSVSSQALWQHGPSQLALTVSLYCLLRGRKEAYWVALAGFPLAFAIIARPTNVIFGVTLVAYVLVYQRQYLWAFLVSGLPPLLFQFWYNSTYFGNPFRSQYSLLEASQWSTPLLEGLGGILLSPSRGLLVYSPIFLFSLVGMGLALRRREDPLFHFLSVGVILTLLLYSKWVMWWGGWTYGPRLLADLTPVLAVLLCPLRDILVRSRMLKTVFSVLLGWSLIAHGIGAFVDDPNLFVPDQRLWSWTDNQLVNPLSKALNSVAGTVRGIAN